jgi:sporulation protein YlmC with PRC-barrel domain
MDAQNEDLKAREIGRLIAADKVQGTEVRNTDGETLGTIENIMIDKPTGRVAYAVMSFGGFLGLGKGRHALPWAMLRYDTDLGGYVVNLDKHQLEGAPAYNESDNFDWENRDWSRRLHEHYQVPPSWL